MVGHEWSIRDSSEGDAAMLMVINIGNVPVMRTRVPSSRQGTGCSSMVLTVVVIGALLGGTLPSADQ